MSTTSMYPPPQSEPRRSLELIQSTSPVATRKVIASVLPGRMIYDIHHGLETEHVLVQTCIAGRIREGGISITGRNTIRLTFGGTLNEPLDIIIVG